MGSKFLVTCILILSLATPVDVLAVDGLKAGVVKISAKVHGKTKIGTGFIVNLEPGVAYIVTASHVIEGAQRPDVAFYTQPHNLHKAKTIGLEGGDPRGLAALMVEGFIPSNVRVLKLDRSVTVGSGEIVETIGFPQMGAIPWAVSSGSVAGMQGRSIVFSGAVDEGNSGGPLIKDGVVVGIITEVSNNFNYAQPIGAVESALTGWGVRTIDETDQRFVKGMLSRFRREHGIAINLTGGQNASIQRISKRYGEYWGQVYLGLCAADVGLVPRDTEESINRVYLALDGAAQVWAGKNIADSLRHMAPLDALKTFGKYIKSEAAHSDGLNDPEVWRVRQKALKNKDIFIKDEFSNGGPKLRQLK